MFGLLRWVLLVFICSSQWAYASTIDKNITQLLQKSALPDSSLGLYVVKLDGLKETVEFQKNSEKKFIPASLTKIITAATVVTNLGLDHKFKTELYIKGKLKGSTLKGDLIVVGKGDPVFTSESMWNLTNEFLRSGIKTIEGRLIIDDSYFDQERFSNGREKTRVDRAYDVPVGAVSFNWNSVNIFVRPGQRVGNKLKIYADPQSDYVQLVNQTKTVGGRGKNLQINRLKHKAQGESYVVKGAMGLRHKEAVIYKNIQDPALWFAYNLKSFLARRGVQFKGAISKGKLKKGSLLVADLESKPLRQILSDLMKFSNNFIAEMFTKHLGADSNRSGQMQRGLGKIKAYLKYLKIKDYKITSPSGFSRRNAFRPQDIYKVLKNMKGNFKVYPEFLTSLPISGVDGSLKSRMKNSSRSWVRAKTGRLNGVLGLAGFAGSRKTNKLYAFVFMYNGDHKNLPKVSLLFDKMAGVLVNSF